MKQEIINTITPERQMYVPASVKVIEVSARRVLCQSGGINDMIIDEDGGNAF